MSRRLERINDLLREEIAEIVARELHDPRLALDMLSITEVQTSGDLHHAVVQVSVMGDEEQQAAATTALNHSHAYIRRLLKPRLRLRAVPALRFEQDTRIAEQRRIADLLDTLQDEALPKQDPAP